MGLGVLGFSLGSPESNADNIAVYKKLIGHAEPVGRYVNDNVLLVSNILCLEDGGKARQIMAGSGYAETGALAGRYHDTFARAGRPVAPIEVGNTTVEDVNESIKNGRVVCGDPNEVMDQLQAYVDVGCDQIGFIMPLSVPMEYALESVRLVGNHVIPKLDRDPGHRTSRFRASAQ